MQLFLSLFFDGSVWELADIVISFYRSKGIPYEVAHQEHEDITAYSHWFVAWVHMEPESEEWLEYMRESGRRYAPGQRVG